MTKTITKKPTVRITRTTELVDSQTATTTVSEVESDIVSYTETDTIFATETDTDTVEATITVTADGLNKRGYTHKPTKLPAYATKGCHNDGRAYASACSCAGVRPKTKYAPRPRDVTKTIYKTVTKPQTQTSVQTNLRTTTVTTVPVTTTYSTTTISQLIATNVVTIVDATEIKTVTQTSTVRVQPPSPTQTFTIKADYAYAQQGSSNVYAHLTVLNSLASFIDFSASSQDQLVFEQLPNRNILVRSGNGSPNLLAFYSRSTGPTSYVLVTTDAFAASQGGTPILCSISSGSLACDWQDQTGAAEFWLCGGHLNLVQPGYDFSNTCAQGGPSFRINVGATVLP